MSWEQILQIWCKKVHHAENGGSLCEADEKHKLKHSCDPRLGLPPSCSLFQGIVPYLLLRYCVPYQSCKEHPLFLIFNWQTSF